MFVMKIIISGEQEIKELDFVLIDDILMFELIDDIIFLKLEGNLKLNQDFIEEIKEMVIKELFIIIVKGKIFFFLNFCKFKIMIEV